MSGSGYAVALVHADGALRPLDEIELDVMRFAVHRCGGKFSEAARRLGIGRSTLYRRLKAAEEESAHA